MSTFGIIFLAFCVWIFYNLFVKLIWPLYKTTSQLKKEFKNMAAQREAQEKTAGAAKPPPIKEKEGEYIDFEEVK